MRVSCQVWRRNLLLANRYFTKRPERLLAEEVQGSSVRLFGGSRSASLVRMAPSAGTKPTDGDLVQAAIGNLNSGQALYSLVDIGINLADSSYEKVSFMLMPAMHHALQLTFNLPS